jgi:hypothetical protein
LNKKPTNPKDAIGSKKVGLHFVPVLAMFGMALAFLEGAIKYGGFNWRVAGIRASVYYDALQRHMTSWWEGQNIDPDSKLPHLYKAMACIAILIDAEANKMLNDDRPPKLSNEDWMIELNKKAEELIAKLPSAVPPYTELTYKQTELFMDVNN